MDKPEEYNQHGQKRIVWEGYGRSVFFGILMKSKHYILYEDSITVSYGINVQRTQSVKLRNIVSKEMAVSAIDRLFRCGSIRLITWGSTTPDLNLYVKNPKAVFQIIEETKSQDKARYLAKKNQRYNNRGTREEEPDATPFTRGG